MKNKKKEMVLKSESGEIQYNLFLGDDMERYKVESLVEKYCWEGT